MVPAQQMGERVRQQDPQALTPSRRSDVDADIASPKESCTPRQMLIFSKGIQILQSTSTPSHSIAEPKPMTSNKSKYSPVQTRSRTRPTNLFGHTERKDSALLTSTVFNHSDYSTMTNAPSFYLDCEEVFSTSRKVTSLLVCDFSKPMCPIHFDDNLQYSQQTTCNVRTHSHGSQHQAFKVSTSQSFVADSISSLPSTPSNDQESMSSPQAQQ